MSLRDDLIAETEDVKPEDVAVPEWKGRIVRIPALDALEMLELFDEAFDGEEAKTRAQTAVQTARIIARVLRDPETNERIFTNEDATWLAKKHLKPTQRLFAAFLKLNKGGKEVVTEAGKSEGEATGAMPSALPPK